MPEYSWKYQYHEYHGSAHSTIPLSHVRDIWKINILSKY